MWWWVCHTQLWHGRAQGGRIRAAHSPRAGGTLLGEALSLLAFQSGGKTQPKQPAVELLPSPHFRGKDTLPSTATWSTATRAGGFAAESLAPSFLTSSFNPEEGGKLLRLPALHRAKVSRNHTGYRKQMAFCWKSKTLHRKSVLISSVDN